MTLLLRTVVTVTVLLVSITATPPPGYVKQPDNDKNPPSYHYNYKIQDNSGEVQGKTETRKGEHATGRYYVNSKQASTDVKYFAGDWGYHPLVKYRSSDDHSSSSASLAFGEHAVKNYNRNNETQSVTDLPSQRENNKVIQVTQPYHQSKQNYVYSSDASKETDQSSNSFSSVSAQQLQSNSVNVDYGSNLPSQSITDTVSSSANDDFLSIDHQSSTTQQHYHHLQQSNILTSQENDISLSSVSAEDQLVVENAGSYGERVHSDTSYSSPIANSIHSGANSLSSVTRDGRYYQDRLHQKNTQFQTSYLPSVLPGLSYFTSTALPSPPLDNSVTANSIESNIGGFESSAINSDANKFEFSKPIVVAEPQPYKEPPFQYSTTFECEDDKSPSTPNPFLYKDDTASSHVLNSIQAGVALINAGEVHLIDQIGESRSPAPVEEKIDDLDQVDQPVQLSHFTKDVGSQTQAPAQAHSYVGINPAFGGQENSLEQKYSFHPNLTTQQQPQTQIRPHPQDQVVEIQKSIEIYHSSPQHEIHYPGILSTQVAQIDQQQRQPTQYFTSSADENSKQSSQSREDINYEITGAYSKVIGGNEPVYVVPPATYILDNNSLQKTNLQKDKIQQYQEDNSQLIQLNEQQSDIYNTEVNHQDQLQTITPKQEQIVREYGEENIYGTQAVKNVIEKKIPYQEGNMNEKKVPVLQPYQITVELPVPQSYPIHVKKTIEQKIPIPIHIPIPQPYPIEEPIQIPVSLEKIVENVSEKKVPYPVEIPKYIEKPSISQALHYGQHYGVSYQQIMKPQNHGLYSHQPSNQHFQRYVYENPAIPSTNVKVNLEHNPFLKKHSYNSYLPPKSNNLHHRRHAAVQRPSDFLGPPPIHMQHTFQPKKSFASRPTLSSRQARNHDSGRYQKSNFRQSKIEYGFKPPMVPSIQYDEESASKVES